MMSDDEQSEDGQVMSGVELSPAEDETTDSLDIKPPQASAASYYAKRKEKKVKDRKHSKDHHRHRMMERERERERDPRDRGGRMDRDHHHRERGSGGGGDPHHHQQQQQQQRDRQSSRGSGRDRGREKQPHHGSRYEMNPFYGELRETYLSKRERERDREREYYEKQRRDPSDKTDPEKILEDLRTRLLHKKSRYDSGQHQREHRDRDMLTEEEQLQLEEAEYYRQKRERKREHHHRRHHEGRERERGRGQREDVVEIMESPEMHYQASKHIKTAEEKEHEARRAKLLEADREMARRKGMAREELEARRLRKEEERQDTNSDTESETDDDEDDEEVEEDEDDVVEIMSVEDREERSKKSKRRKAEQESDTNSDSDSSSSGTEEESKKSANEHEEEEEEEDEKPPDSPLSVGDLAKSERKSPSPLGSRYQSRSRSRTRSGSGSDSRSRSRSPHHRHEDSKSRSSSREKTDKGNEQEKPGDPKSPDAAPEEAAESEVTLPPYFPGIQGCRSVEEFLCLNRIEEGTYGVVYRARDKRTEEIVALKRLKMEKEKEGFPITSLREINTLLKGQHPNIVTVREIVVGSNMDKIFIVMDYVEHDLKSLMETMKHKSQVFLPGEVKCLTQQLLRAVAHLHDNWILHRDLKTSNLLLSHKGILKVGDFGLAREYGSPLKPYTSIVVTLWYRAPELLLCCKEYSTPIDIWSVGCIFAEFLSMSALFRGKTEIDQLNRIFKDLGTPNEKIWPGYSQLPAVQKMTFTEYPVSNLRKKFSHLTSELGISLLQGLLTFDPKQRLTAENALEHSYFKELPLPIDPAMFPTWPAKSELGLKKALASSPKPPSGGGEFKKLGDDAVPENLRFHLGAATYAESRQMAMGPGFSLKF